MRGWHEGAGPRYWCLLDTPDDPVRRVVYPAVAGGEQTLRELVHEFKTKGPLHRRTVQTTLKAPDSPPVVTGNEQAAPGHRAHTRSRPLAGGDDRFPVFADLVGPVA